MSSAPTILVFDSGLGGLTVFREVVKARPDAAYVYVADDAFFPYGSHGEAELIGRVVPDGQALEAALSVAETIAANGPVAVRTILRVIRETEGMAENEAFTLEAQAGMAVFASEDAREGPRAFAEKRRPEFRDR